MLAKVGWVARLLAAQALTLLVRAVLVRAALVLAALVLAAVALAALRSLNSLAEETVERCHRDSFGLKRH